MSRRAQTAAPTSTWKRCDSGIDLLGLAYLAESVKGERVLISTRLRLMPSVKKPSAEKPTLPETSMLDSSMRTRSSSSSFLRATASISVPYTMWIDGTSGAAPRRAPSLAATTVCALP